MDLLARAPRVGLRGLAALAVLACCLVSVSAAWAKPALASKQNVYAKVSPACPPPTPGDATCFALVRVPEPAVAVNEAGVKPYKVGDGALESGPAGGLTPADLASAYGYSAAAGGSGQTIAIVDAYDDPAIEEDLGAFDTEYGIAACTKANGCFTKVSQTGSTTSLPPADETGWSVEISLDVETAHSTCPKCKILLVEANSASFKNLATAVSEAVALGATEVSNSYGGPEGGLGASEKAAYNHPGVVIAAATGDLGYDDWTYLNEGYEPPGKPNIPATLPTVVAVGGTSLELSEQGTRESETVWNGNGPLDENEDEGVAGGGCSTMFTAPLWQQATPGWAQTHCGSKRLAADVSAVADPRTGFDIFDTYDCGASCEAFGAGKGWLTIGGTSLSTPLVSAMYALAGGSDGVSDPALTLYGHVGEAASLYDVTEGGNGICDYGGLACGANELFGVNVDCEGTTACNAVQGFDGPSGVGAPNSLSLFKPLLPSAAITLPSSPRAGLPGTFSGSGSSDPYPGGSISSYSWSWGDGTPSSSGVAPAHTYAAPGEYTVTLTVTDSYGLTSAPVAETVKVEEEAKKHEEEVKHEEETKKHEEEVKKHEEEVKRHEEEVKRHEEETKKHGEEEATKKHEEEHAKLAVLGAKEGSPDATIADTPVTVGPSGAFHVTISCPAGQMSCTGTVTLVTLHAVSAGVGARESNRAAKVLTLAVGTFTIGGGQSKTVTLHLSSAARRLLAREHTLSARVTIVADNPSGGTHIGHAILALRERRAKHRRG